jgi:hypothetical protein
MRVVFRLQHTPDFKARCFIPSVSLLPAYCSLLFCAHKSWSLGNFDIIYPDALSLCNWRRETENSLLDVPTAEDTSSCPKPSVLCGYTLSLSLTSVSRCKGMVCCFVEAGKWRLSSSFPSSRYYQPLCSLCPHSVFKTNIYDVFPLRHTIVAAAAITSLHNKHNFSITNRIRITMDLAETNDWKDVVKEECFFF